MLIKKNNNNVGFKRGRKQGVSSEFEHRWIQWPNYGTMKCTKCGMIKRKIGEKLYYFNSDGSSTTEAPKCLTNKLNDNG